MSRASRSVRASRAAVSGAATLVAGGLLLQKGFNILKGGNLAGSYTIGQFQDCKLATLLINLTIPGSGNTIKLTLGKAHLG
jgi:hypothetical protein